MQLYWVVRKQHIDCRSLNPLNGLCDSVTFPGKQKGQAHWSIASFCNLLLLVRCLGNQGKKITDMQKNDHWLQDSILK